MRLSQYTLALMFGLAIAAATAPAWAQSTRYVTDSLRLDARSGPGNDNRIVRMLESGTAVEVLADGDDGWSRVRLPGGEEAWMLTRFLMREPAARERVESAQEVMDAARAEAARAQAQMAALSQDVEALRAERDRFEAMANATAAELAELKRTASGAVALQEENRVLSQSAAQFQQQYQSAQLQLAVMDVARRRDWFIAGAGVLLGGILLGLLIPKIRWRRRRGWGEL